MPKLYKKTVSLIFAALFMVILTAPAVFAQDTNCDNDGDGYIVIPNQATEFLWAEGQFDPNGSYTAIEWNSFYKTFKNDAELSEELCGVLTFKKGAEPERCDEDIISASSGVYDPAKVRTLTGSQVHPGAFDKPDNGIDEDCDGADGKLIADTGGEEQLSGLVDKVIAWLSRAVVIVSIIILIWGGMLYTTAAGDEQKTAKARKAIIGAIIGLIVGLLAPAVVNWVISSLG